MTAAALILRPGRLIGLVLMLGVAGAAWWAWHGIHTSTPVDRADAVAEFRAAGTAGGRTPAGAPAAGVYRYSVTGSERAGSGPLEASRDLPGEAVYVITPRAGGYHEDLRLSKEHVEEADFRVDAAGTSATWRRTKVTFLGIGTDDRAAVQPASLDHPRRMAVGRTWRGAYRLGEIAVTFSSRVTGRETVVVDGARVPVWVLRTDSRFTGPTPGTRTDVVRFAPALSLPVRWSIDQRTGGSADYAISADLTLVSGRPER